LKSCNLFEILAHWRKWFGPIVRGVIQNASITYNNFDINWLWHNAHYRERTPTIAIFHSRYFPEKIEKEVEK
jgi:hypothetical protein